MEESKYYFVQKKEMGKIFPYKVLDDNWAEVENLETGEKENLTYVYNKTEIDVRFQKRAQQINSFIEREGVVLHPFIPPFGEDN